MIINEYQGQMTLAFDPTITERFRSVKEAIAAGVYQRGLKRTAGDLDMAPGNLSVQLAGDGGRNFDTDSLERYVEVTGDKTPIYFLVAKYCGENTAREEAVDKVRELMAQLPELLTQVGLNNPRKGRR